MRSPHSNISPAKRGNLLLFSSLTMFFLTVLGSQLSNAQTQSWKTTVTNDFDNPAAWASGNVPDSLAETAKFGLFGNSQVNFAAPTTPTLSALQVSNGTVQFRSNSAGEKTLTLANGIQVTGGTLEVDQNNFASNVHLVSNGVTTIDEGEISFWKEASLVTACVDITGGSSSSGSELKFEDDATGNLGTTNIAANGEGPHGGLLTIQNDASVIVGDLNIATAVDADRQGVVQLISGSTLSQPTGVTNVGANSVTGVAEIFVAFNAEFLGDDVRVFSNGELTNYKGHFAFENSLLLDGGTYTETGIGTRLFGPNSTFTLQNGGEATFLGSALNIVTGQTLVVENSQFDSAGGLEITGGTVHFQGTTADIHAAATIAAGSSLTVHSGATATFHQSVSNTGGTIMLEANSVIEFANTYEGIGTTGLGTTRFLNDVAPGTSPGVASFGGDAEWTDDARLLIEIGGTAVGTWDQTNVAGIATLAGTLEINPIDLGGGIYNPTIGDRFAVVQADSLSGTFETVSLPSLAAGSRWIVSYANSQVELQVVLEGDFNADGMVDAADYTVWRDQLGSSGQYLAADGNGDGTINNNDYQKWVDNYGINSNVSSELTTTAVPEPNAGVVCLIACGMLQFFPRKGPHLR